MILVNAEWYFVSHRLPLGRALRASGYEVVVAAGVERSGSERIVADGLRFVPLNLRRRSRGLLQEARTIREIYSLYKRERPCIVHHVTIKPILYGSLAARLARVPKVVNAITGMGAAFAQPGLGGALLRWCLATACRLAFKSEDSRVIFQNPQDRAWFVDRGIVPAHRAVLIRGAGVDITRFTRAPFPSGPPIVLLASRLLWDKGVGEFVEASRLLKQRGVSCRFVLVGVPDGENPNPIPQGTLDAWQAEGIVECWGHRDDMPAVIQSATIVTLPTTYPEGVPKILLEAAACGRGIVATDVPGCREIVTHGQSGLLIRPRDPAGLAHAVALLLEDRPLLERLAANARKMAESDFSEEKTIAATLDVYTDLLRSEEPVAV